MTTKVSHIMKSTVTVRAKDVDTERCEIVLVTS